MGAGEVATASLRKHRSNDLQRLLQESLKDEHGNGGESSPRLRGREIASRYRAATVSSSASQRRSPSPTPPSRSNTSREKSPEIEISKRDTTYAVNAPVDKRKPRPAGGAENKTPASSNSDIAPPRERRRLPARSFDGLWPSSLRSVDADGKSRHEITEAYDQISVRGRLSNVDSGSNQLAKTPGTPGRKLGSLEEHEDDPNSSRVTDDKTRERSDQNVGSKVGCKVNREHKESKSDQKIRTTLSEQLGEHFENLDSRRVRQIAPGQKAEDEIKTPERSIKENGKPFENLNSKVVNDHNSGKEKKSSSLSRVASLLVPSRYRKSTASSKAAEKPATGAAFLSRSSSRSAVTVDGLTSGNARVVRCLSLDGRETGKGGTAATKAGSRGTAATPGPAERVCRSFNGLENLDGGLSDSESTSSGGSAARRIATDVLPEVSWTATEKRGHHRRTVSGAPVYRRTEAALDAALMNNRWLQWCFVNTRAETALLAQAKTAESCLYNAAWRIHDFQASVSAKRILLDNVKHQLKLHSVLSSVGKQLEEWDTLRSEHSMTLKGVEEALEATVTNVPLVSGAKIEIQSFKDALASAISVMNGVDVSVSKFLPKVEVADSLLSKLAETIILERACLQELNELIWLTNELEIEERSLRTYSMQVEQENIIKNKKLKSNSLLQH